MDDKILSFNEDPPVDSESILRLLSNVEEDILAEYSNATLSFAEELFDLVKIVSAASRPNLCRHLINGLSEVQLTKLNKISLSLASEDPLEKINELLEATFNLVIPADESRRRAIELVAQVKTLPDVEYEAEAGKFARAAKQLRMISDIFCLLNIGDEFEELLIDRLSVVSEADLERMIQVVNNR